MQAQPGQAVVGVVVGRAELVIQKEHRPTESGKRLVPREGAAQPGEYVTIVYSGPIQVKVAPGESAIVAGTRLTAATEGSVRRWKGPARASFHLLPWVSKKRCTKVTFEVTRTLAAVHSKIASGQYDIVHFATHGKEHVLQTTDGVIQEDMLEHAIRKACNLRVLFLNACRSAHTAVEVYNPS